MPVAGSIVPVTFSVATNWKVRLIVPAIGETTSWLVATASEVKAASNAPVVSSHVPSRPVAAGST